jgi:hypothetical protein
MIVTHFTVIKQSVGLKKTDPAVLQSLIDVISATIEDGFIKASLAAHGVDDKLSLPEHTG